jgi:hypothetical protein
MALLFAVVSEHDVLVATAGACGEVTHVICIECADGLDRDMKFLGRSRRGCCRWCDVWGGDGRFWFGGVEPLLGLGEVAFSSFSAVGAVSGSIGVLEAWSPGIVAGFDGSQPSELDGEAGHSM